MVFGGNKILIFIRSNALNVYSGGEVKSLPFSADIVSNLEVIDKIKFADLLKKYFAPLKLKGSKTVIVVGPELTFEKVIANDASQKQLQEQFFNQVPFGSENISTKVILEGKNLRLLATNSDLFGGTISALKSLGAETLAVLPFSVLGLSGSSIDQSNIGTIVNNKNAIKIGNFLKTPNEQKSIDKNNKKIADKEDNVEVEEKEGKLTSLRKNQMVLAVFGVLLIVGAALIVAYAFGIFKRF